MFVSKYVFILPFITAIVLLMWILVQRQRSKRVKTRNVLVRSTGSFLKNLLIPKKDTKLHNIYAYMLRYTKWNVEIVFKAKLVLFLSIFLIVVLVKGTNITLYTKEIMSKFNYHADLIYQGEPCLDEQQAFEQEMQFFRQALATINYNVIKNTPKEQVEDTIKSFIASDASKLLQPRDAITNKIYYRILDYYECRKWNFSVYLLLSFLFSFIIELALLIYNFFAETESKKEIRFLKKLIILNGSIKPVDFLKLLKILSDKAVYHKKVLVEIEEMNKKNSVDNRKIYHYLIKNAKDIEMKLFYEKLDQANNYDFDQAIINIENEFQMDRRAQARKIKKQTELIHAVGITGFMALIFILILYLIIPWLEMYNMNQIY